MFQERVSVQSSASAHSSREKKRADLILIIGQQSLFGLTVHNGLISTHLDMRKKRTFILKSLL